MSLPGAAERDGSASASRSTESGRGFPRTVRLTARKQFQTVYREGLRVRSPSFTLFGLPNTLGHCRLGITVTRKVGKAAVRNRIKRKLREVFRANRDRLEPALDLVVNGYLGCAERPVAELEREFLRSFRALARRFDR